MKDYYPKLMKGQTGVVTLFTEEGVGVVKAKGDSCWEVGHKSSNWGMSTFVDYNRSEKELLSSIEKWHEDRNLIDGATDITQFGKLLEEVNELYNNIVTGKSPADDIGDIIVVLVNIATRNNLTIRQCLETAWLDIKDRKGKMVDGVFVKEIDNNMEEHY